VSKYVFVVGGVYSGTGKGITAASVALLMKMRGLKVEVAKFDPYLNVNAGTMSPGQHGECYLCNDGSETDLDLGHYERITGIEVSSRNIFTGGTLYKELLAEEEEGRYLGQTVQMVPHVTNKLIERFEMLGQDADIVFAEIGGTVGDMESAGFMEAVKMFKQQHWEDTLICMVAPILWAPTIQEFKTKPLQNSVRSLNSFGLPCELLMCRVPESPSLPPAILDKIAKMCGVHRSAVFDAPDVKSVYQVPVEMWARHVDDLIADKFHLPRNGVRIHKYRDLVEKYVNADSMGDITIGIVGKYDNAEEAYISLKEALYHAGVAENIRVRRKWISAEEIKNKAAAKTLLGDCDGVIVPGGFDKRGVDGKMQAIRYCRENKVPFLGICLGLQCAVIEFAKNVLGLANATSQEFDKETEHPVIHFVEGQENIRKKCGTMRLGAFSCEITPDTLAHAVYKKKIVSERHRHRYEVNTAYVERLAQKGGLRVSGRHPDTGLVEIMELPQEAHPFFIGTQAHPEFKSRLGSPAPLFQGLIAASVARHKIMSQASDETFTEELKSLAD
jgi:CTP synthase